MNTPLPPLLQKNFQDDFPAQLGPFPLEWLRRDARWQAVAIFGLAYPLSAAVVRALRIVLDALDGELTSNPAISAETAVQFSQLHVGDCASLFSERGQSWQPRMGLGVFPDQPPPELWSEKDFEVMPGPDAKLRPLMNTVLRVDSKKVIQDEVAAECLLCGGVLRFYTEDLRGFLRKSKAELLPRLKGSSFQGFLFYLPLLNVASFSGTSDEQIDHWLPGISAYVAECPDEDALVFGYRGDLVALLRLLQLQLENEERPRLPG